ncbi:hypothetical protein ACHQM5_026081 [Ranunculus cassubicifolius]
MEGNNKVITICQFGGEFVTNKDGSFSYKGGEAHAIDIDHETPFDEFKSEIAEMVNCSPEMVVMKYFLFGNKHTLITISNEKDLKRMISFNEDSGMVDVYVTSGETIAYDLSYMPGSRSSRNTLAEGAVQIDAPLRTENGSLLDACIDIPIDGAPSVFPNISDTDHHKVPSSWENAITGVGQRFSNVHEFRDALHKFAIGQRFVYKFLKNDPLRVTARCKTESCPWRIHASRLSCTQVFCVKKLNPTHTCEGGVMPIGSHATTNLIAGIVKEKLRDSPDYRPKDIVNDIKQEYGVQLNYYQARRGKEIARGSYEEAYSQLPFLCEKIIETNPGSFATFTTKDDLSFHRLFISFDASLHGFQLGCRPLLFLDSIRLKSKYQEGLLLATSIDGDAGVFPVAFAVVDEETVENWKWFLTDLKSAISTSEPITFVADMEKGLRESIAEVFENSHHSFCLRYLSESFRKSLPTQFSNEVKRMLIEDFTAAAYAIKFDEYYRRMESIRDISQEAFDWVMESDPQHWANIFFKGVRYSYMSSDFGDSFYSWVLEAQHMPITQLVHMIRGKTMELIYTRRVNSSQWVTQLSPSMEAKLQTEISKAESIGVEVMPSLDEGNIFDVGDETVDIDEWSCSCKMWQINGLPCFHAVSVLNWNGRNLYDYCLKYLTSEYYRLTYSKSINPGPFVDKPIQKVPAADGGVAVKPPPRRVKARGKRKRNAPEELQIIAEEVHDVVASDTQLEGVHTDDLEEVQKISIELVAEEVSRISYEVVEEVGRVSNEVEVYEPRQMLLGLRAPSAPPQPTSRGSSGSKNKNL